MRPTRKPSRTERCCAGLTTLLLAVLLFFLLMELIVFFHLPLFHPESHDGSVTTALQGHPRSTIVMHNGSTLVIKMHPRPPPKPTSSLPLPTTTTTAAAEVEEEEEEESSTLPMSVAAMY